MRMCRVEGRFKEGDWFYTQDVHLVATAVYGKNVAAFASHSSHPAWILNLHPSCRSGGCSLAMVDQILSVKWLFSSAFSICQFSICMA